MAGISVLKRLFSSEKHSQDQRKPPIKVCTSIPITDRGAILIGAHRPLRLAGDVVMVLFMRPGGRLSLSLSAPTQIEDSYQTIQDDQPLNPYTEALLLQGHTGSIVKVSCIDTNRWAGLGSRERRGRG